MSQSPLPIVEAHEHLLRAERILELLRANKSVERIAEAGRLNDVVGNQRNHWHLKHLLRETALREAQALARDSFLAIYHAAGFHELLPDGEKAATKQATDWLATVDSPGFEERVSEAARLLTSLSGLQERYEEASKAVGKEAEPPPPRR